ncbi:MAG: hypothetical protein PHT02_14340 [Tissierellia bacterium]|nr:hypothetical protein [Tissierellia bacterium]
MNSYQVQRFNNKYHVYNNSNFNIYKNEESISNKYGYIQITITNLGNVITTNSVLTITVNKNGNEISVIRMPLTENPTLIKLPIAHPEGTLAKGQEYYFTLYNLTIGSEGYYTIITRNIRLFPNIKTVFNYNLNKRIPGISNGDQITDIPQHPRD